MNKSQIVYQVYIFRVTTEILVINFSFNMKKNLYIYIYLFFLCFNDDNRQNALCIKQLINFIINFNETLLLHAGTRTIRI